MEPRRDLWGRCAHCVRGLIVYEGKLVRCGWCDGRGIRRRPIPKGWPKQKSEGLQNPVD